MDPAEVAPLFRTGVIMFSTKRRCTHQAITVTDPAGRLAQRVRHTAKSRRNPKHWVRPCILLLVIVTVVSSA